MIEFKFLYLRIQASTIEPIINLKIFVSLLMYKPNIQTKNQTIS